MEPWMCILAAISTIIGLCVGYVLSLILRLFFEDEIYDWIEKIVLRVRKRFGLN